MAKISQASSKYIIRANIEIDGVVDRPDVVGAIFGQIEGLLGADLELRELQRSGRIGRIEVQVKSKDGKTAGTITIPSSLDKAETAIVAGALEIIERIGPCSANITITDIEDERIAKRQQVINRAKELLKRLQDNVLPDSGELSNEVSDSVRIMEIVAFGKDNLPAGPGMDEEEIICVEGRADVVNLLKHGFNNVIAINGTSVPDTIKELSKQKEITLFCDGDRGGDLIIKEMMETCDVEFITKAPDGKEVEELQKKEIHHALRHKVKANEWKTPKKGGRKSSKKSMRTAKKSSGSKKSDSKSSSRSAPKKPRLSGAEKEQYAKLFEEVKGKDAAYLLDKDHDVLGKVSMDDLAQALPSLDGVHATIMGGKISADVAKAVDKSRPKHVVAAESGAKMRSALITPEDLK